MDINRIQRELGDAQRTFSSVQLYPLNDGTVYAKAALQTVQNKTYVVSVRFTENYPHEMPRVFIEAPAITNAPHRYQGGHICYLHPTMWNPGAHNLSFVIGRTAKWLSKYEVWKVKGRWPGASLQH
jgi:ubiquitin-protein ligase